jgi:hypothetical protein
VARFIKRQIDSQRGLSDLVSNAAPSTPANTLLADEAFILMERAQLLLDHAGLTQAAIYLDHALALIPDGSGIFPRKRTSPPLTF